MEIALVLQHQQNTDGLLLKQKLLPFHRHTMLNAKDIQSGSFPLAVTALNKANAVSLTIRHSLLVNYTELHIDAKFIRKPKSQPYLLLLRAMPLLPTESCVLDRI